tara:strand:+ start:1417 stop:2085 length:669 start_codon:yes stop_codon:yes gene_type:complete
MLALKQALSLVSTRKLGSAWSPADESSLEAWWQNREGVTLNGSDISQWDDSSTNTNDLTQVTASRQPAYSLGILTFDGTGHNMTCPQLSLAAFTVGIRGDFTGVSGRTIIGDDDAGNEFIKFKNSTTLTLRVSAGNVDFALASGVWGDGYITITRDASNLVSATYNGAVLGTPQTRANTVKIDNLGYSSTAGYYTGTIKEVQIYTSSSTDLTANINTRLATL